MIKNAHTFQKLRHNPKKHEKRIHSLSLIASLIIASIGCQSHSVQTTSGRQYLNQYEELDLPIREAGSIDEEVREIANVEPTLRFPARIGIAKLYNGRISNLTVEEVEGWEEAKEEMGTGFGEFIPVSSMIAELAYTPDRKVAKTSQKLRRSSAKSARSSPSTPRPRLCTKSFPRPRPPSCLRRCQLDDHRRLLDSFRKIEQRSCQRPPARRPKRIPIRHGKLVAHRR